MLPGALLATLMVCAGSVPAQTTQPPSQPAVTKPQPPTHQSHAHKGAKKQIPPPVAQTPPPPPMPDWPVNDKPSPASVVWDASGLRINASNSSLQQILNEVSTETGNEG